MKDYSEFQEKPGDNAMAALNELAKQQLEKEAKVAELQRQLEEAQGELALVQERLLPDLMEQMRLNQFKTIDGVEIEVALSVHTSIPKTKQDDAFKWLETNHQGGLIKRNVIISFGRDDEKWASKFLGDMKKRKRPLASKVERKVEPSTLKAFVVRSLEAGVDIPTELFGLHRRRITKVKMAT